MIRNLAFKGGGVLGIAYVGVLKVLGDKGLLKYATRFAGTSAGNIIATLQAVGYTPDEIHSIMTTVQLPLFEDAHGWLGEIAGELSSLHGLYRGHYFQSWIEGLIKAKIGKDKATYQDIYGATGNELYTVVSNINTGNIEVLNYKDNPKRIASEGARASMCVPFVFDKFSFTQGGSTTDQYWDGGIAMNYPLPVFDDQPLEETLGLFLHDTGNKGGSLPVHGLLNSAKAAFNLAVNGQSLVTLKSARAMSVTMKVNNLGYDALNFGISQTYQTAIYESGIESANDYFHETEER